MKSLAGFTLVEIIIAVALFSLTLGTIFSVVGAVRRTELFRDANAGLTTAAGYGFEPLARAIRTANGLTQVPSGGQGICIRGFYIRLNDPAVEQSGDLASETLSTLTIERRPARGTTASFIIRRDYHVSGGQLTETTFEQPRLAGCPNYVWGPAVANRTLTPAATVVGPLAFRLRSEAAGVAPFASFRAVIAWRPPHTSAPPVSWQTTVAPTFSEGRPL